MSQNFRTLKKGEEKWRASLFIDSVREKETLQIDKKRKGKINDGYIYFI